MGTRIIYEVPGATIEVSDEAGTLVPYGPAPREDSYNHGWLDLRDAPELVDSVPEAQKSAGLAEVLRAFNEPGSPMMTIGCDCAAFNDEESDPPFYVGSFIDVCFRDASKNTEGRLVDVAGVLLNHIPPAPGDLHMSFNMQVAPLRSFFGQAGCYALMMRPRGAGLSPEHAMRSFDHAAREIARSYRLAKAGS